MKSRNTPDGGKVEIEFEGKTYEAIYVVEKGTIDVNGRCTQLGGMRENPETLARMMLREQVEAGAIEPTD